MVAILVYFGEACKTDGIHFEDGGGGDDIADRTMEPRKFPEIVKAWGMEKDQIRLCHKGLFRGSGFFRFRIF